MTIPDWINEFVRASVEKGISNGERPMDKATRGEVMGMQLKLLEYLLDNYNLKKK